MEAAAALRCTQAGTLDSRVPVVLQNPGQHAPGSAKMGKMLIMREDNLRPSGFFLFCFFLLDFMITVSKGCRSWGEY